MTDFPKNNRFLNAQRAMGSKGRKVLQNLREEEQKSITEISLHRFPSLEQNLEKSRRKIVELRPGDVLAPSLASHYVKIHENEISNLVKKLKLPAAVIENASKHFSAFALKTLELLGKDDSVLLLKDILNVGRVGVSSLLSLLGWEEVDPQKLHLVRRMLFLFHKDISAEGEFLLDFSSFVSILSLLSDTCVLNDKARFAFMLFDHDQDHLIDFYELYQSLKICLKANNINLNDMQMSELVFNTLKSYGVPKTTASQHMAAAFEDKSNRISYAVSYLISIATINRNINAQKFVSFEAHLQNKIVLENQKRDLLASFHMLLPDYQMSNVWSYCINVSQYSVMITSFPRLMTLFTMEIHDIFENSPRSSAFFNHAAFSKTSVIAMSDGQVMICPHNEVSGLAVTHNNFRHFVSKISSPLHKTLSANLPFESPPKSLSNDYTLRHASKLDAASIKSPIKRGTFSNGDVLRHVHPSCGIPPLAPSVPSPSNSVRSFSSGSSEKRRKSIDISKRNVDHASLRKNGLEQTIRRDMSPNLERGISDKFRKLAFEKAGNLARSDLIPEECSVLSNGSHELPSSSVSAESSVDNRNPSTDALLSKTRTFS